MLHGICARADRISAVAMAVKPQAELLAFTDFGGKGTCIQEYSPVK